MPSPGLAAGAVAFAAVFGAVSLGATAVSATAGRLLEDEDSDRETRR